MAKNKTPLYKADEVLFTSDLHWFHRSAVKFRGFSSIAVMNTLILHNIALEMDETKTLFILGDVALCGSAEHKIIAGWLNALAGRKVLIEGNHDKGMKPILRNCFDEIHQTHEIDVMYNDSKHRVFMSHYAHRVWNKSHYGALHLYGHSHGNLDGFGRSMDVGVDANGFKPVTFQRVMQKIGDIPISIVDHHIPKEI